MISALILTAGRAALLQKCLDGLAAGHRVPDETLVLVTTHDPDGAAVLRDHSLPGLNWFEWNVDGSYAEARNQLVGLATCPKVAFIDDDCIPDPSWVRRAEESLDRLDAVGGLVLPANKLRYPKWWHPDMAWMVGFSVPGQLGRHAGSVHYPQTANLAARKATLEAESFQELGGKFSATQADYALGREDAELWRRLRRGGYAVAFDPKQLVFHNIPQERLAWESLLLRARNDGRALARREMNHVALEQAWRDTAYGPLTAFRNVVRHPWPNNPQRALDTLWRERQREYLKSFIRSANGQQAQAWRDARIAGIKHVAVSEIKRPIGRTKAFVNLAIGPRRTSLHPPKRILVAMAGYIGDSVLIAPAIQALRKANPQLVVDFATTSSGIAELYKNQQLFDSIHVISPVQKRETIGLDRLIDRGDYNAIVAPYFHPALYPKVGHLFRGGGPFVVMFDEDNGLIRQSDRIRPTTRVPREWARSETLALADLFGVLAPMAAVEPWRFKFSAEELKRTENELKEINPGGAPVVAIHPGAGREEKSWVWERWFDLAANLEAEGLRCLFLGDKSMVGRIGATIEKQNIKAGLATPQSIRRLALLMRGADLFIGTDSGPLQLARAVGRSSVGLFGPTDERRWGPLWEKERHIVLRRCAWDLTPEERSGLPENHQMAMIQTRDVFEAAMSQLH